MSLATGSATVGLRFAALTLMLVSVIGCSGRPRNIARKVTGKVTLGGQPLAGALVMFTPLEGGSPSAGRTNEAGEYNLVWAQQRVRSIEGAQIGEHTVKISTHVDAMPALKPPRAGAPEKVPYKYRADATPKATVKAGANVIDFELEPGPVDPPAAKGKGKKK
jgi:hypothetical protein